jgi:hypothetical protein
MQLNNRVLIVVVKVLIVLWGIISQLQGAWLGMGIDSHSPSANWESAFYYLVYSSVLFIGAFSFVSSRVVSVLLLIVSIVAFGTLYWTRATGHGLDLIEGGEVAIVIRPALVSLLLYVVSRWEKSNYLV